jgi:hypothetical protein
LQKICIAAERIAYYKVVRQEGKNERLTALLDTPDGHNSLAQQDGAFLDDEK